MPNQLACNDDTPDCGLSSSLSFFAVAGQSYFIRVASFSAASSGTFPLNIASGLHLELSSPLGPGSLMLAYLAGIPNGTYFFAVTVVPGNYPNGWLFGLDIPYSELALQMAAGFPFTGPLDACGRFVLGPFPGVPPGLTIFAIAFGFPPGSIVPTKHSLATSYTVP
jgi:hypothetical protein